MKDYNDQILKYLEKRRSAEEDQWNKRLSEILMQSMDSLKFGHPVRNEEELEEVVELCVLYHDLEENPDLNLRELQEPPEGYDIALSLTQRCGNACRHCSTRATLACNKSSVRFEDLDGILREIAPFTRFLYISCEGDPFYYQSIPRNTSNHISQENIVDVAKLLVKYEFDRISFQSMAPTPKSFPLLEEFLNVLDRGKGKEFSFLPQLSFNLYIPRAGLQSRIMKDDQGHEFIGLHVPSVKKEKFEPWLEKILKTFSASAPSDKEQVKISESSNKLIKYLNEVKSTIIAYISRGYPVHFELRGDSMSPFTSPNTLKRLLNEVLDQVASDCPEQKLSTSVSSGYTVPLGRATQLFPNGSRQEKLFFNRHVKMNPHKYLCDNWKRWTAITVDTEGFPQLCYSNLALTPEARTTEGPNLYRDGFERIRDFYIQAWKDRMNFLKDNFPRLVKFRPNDHYCPLALFKRTLSRFR